MVASAAVTMWIAIPMTRAGFDIPNIKILFTLAYCLNSKHTEMRKIFESKEATFGPQ